MHLRHWRSGGGDQTFWPLAPFCWWLLIIYAFVCDSPPGSRASAEAIQWTVKIIERSSPAGLTHIDGLMICQSVSFIIIIIVILPYFANMTSKIPFLEIYKWISSYQFSQLFSKLLPSEKFIYYLHEGNNFFDMPHLTHWQFIYFFAHRHW